MPAPGTSLQGSVWLDCSFHSDNSVDRHLSVLDRRFSPIPEFFSSSLRLQTATSGHRLVACSCRYLSCFLFRRVSGLAVSSQSFFLPRVYCFFYCSVFSVLSLSIPSAHLAPFPFRPSPADIIFHVGLLLFSDPDHVPSTYPLLIFCYSLLICFNNLNSLC